MNLAGRLQRRWYGYRACAVRTCPYPRAEGITKWCRDHTDAILAGGPMDKDGDIARRVGSRRWLLNAEVLVERERAHVAVLDQILAMTEDERTLNRRYWNLPYPTVTPPMTERVDELLARQPKED